MIYLALAVLVIFAHVLVLGLCRASAIGDSMGSTVARQDLV